MDISKPEYIHWVGELLVYSILVSIMLQLNVIECIPPGKTMT